MVGTDGAVQGRRVDREVSQMWKLDYDDKHIDVIWTSKVHPHCRFCKTPVVGHMLKKMKISDIDGYSGHALDIECICPDCGAMYIFGTAITKKDFESIKCLEIPA